MKAHTSRIKAEGTEQHKQLKMRGINTNWHDLTQPTKPPKWWRRWELNPRPMLSQRE
jgi:hypothetical protein